jgi:hypothetical protein
MWQMKVYSGGYRWQYNKEKLDKDNLNTIFNFDDKSGKGIAINFSSEREAKKNYNKLFNTLIDTEESKEKKLELIKLKENLSKW